MDEILGNLPNCMAIADDVILFVTSFYTMYDALDEVLNRFLECRITLNKHKYELFIKKVEFFGFVVSGNGITPSQTKIESIQKMGMKGGTRNGGTLNAGTPNPKQ